MGEIPIWTTKCTKYNTFWFALIWPFTVDWAQNMKSLLHLFFFSSCRYFICAHFCCCSFCICDYLSLWTLMHFLVWKFLCTIYYIIINIYIFIHSFIHFIRIVEWSFGNYGLVPEFDFWIVTWSSQLMVRALLSIWKIRSNGLVSEYLRVSGFFQHPN